MLNLLKGSSVLKAGVSDFRRESPGNDWSIDCLAVVNSSAVRCLSWHAASEKVGRRSFISLEYSINDYGNGAIHEEQTLSAVSKLILVLKSTGELLRSSCAAKRSRERSLSSVDEGKVNHNASIRQVDDWGVNIVGLRGNLEEVKGSTCHKDGNCTVKVSNSSRAVLVHKLAKGSSSPVACCGIQRRRAEDSQLSLLDCVLDDIWAVGEGDVLDWVEQLSWCYLIGCDLSCQISQGNSAITIDESQQTVRGVLIGKKGGSYLEGSIDTWDRGLSVNDFTSRILEVNTISAISIVDSDCWVSITRRGSFVVGEESIGKDTNGSVSVGSPDDDCSTCRGRKLFFP